MVIFFAIGNFFFSITRDRDKLIGILILGLIGVSQMLLLKLLAVLCV